MIFERKQIDETLHEILEAVNQLERRADKVETILIVRDPGSAAAGEAYDGLRRQLVAVVTERLAHLSQLVQFDAALRHGATTTDLAKLVDGWLEQSGLDRVATVDEAADDLSFELVEDRGGPIKVLEPAYIDSKSGRIIRRGRASRGAPTGVESDPSPADHQTRPISAPTNKGA